jgi:c-di-GMP-binding flagellar brake protein YcgR
MANQPPYMPKIHQKVELQILSGPFAAAYSTVVADVDRTGLTLAHPLLGGRLIPVERGEPVRVEYALTGAARIAFLTTVETVHARPLPEIRLALPDPMRIARFQERSFVRLPIRLPLRYRMVEEAFAGLNLPLNRQGEVRDLSASGIQVALADECSRGDRLELAFSLGDEAFHLVGEVVRVIGRDQSGGWLHGLRFLSMDETQRSAILRFIFAQQRERRRLGLL